MTGYDPWDPAHLARQIQLAKSILGHAQGREKAACDEALLVLQGADMHEIDRLRKAS